MTNGQLLAEAWDFEPAVILGSAALFLAYLWVVRFRMNRKTALFGSGVLLMLLTLIGPLDFLGDRYLFSAHMMEHILLYLAVPPLLLLGLPRSRSGRCCPMTLRLRPSACFASRPSPVFWR